jgi:heme/copper-type cytochrome/quinol oxidase subunit 3
MWWGITGFVAIESTMLALTLVSYYSFRAASPQWPPAPISPPSLGYATLTMGLLLASLLPMYWTEHEARRLNLRRVILGHIACDVIGIAFLVSRAFELTAVHVRWDTNAYGSVVWTLLGLHTAHLAAEVIETIVFTIMLAVGYDDPRYLVDATDNGLYWYFIVGIWIPCYVTIYLVPRWFG